MVIARKLLTPTLAFFVVVLVAVIAFFANNTSRSLVVEEERYLMSLQQALEEEIARMSDVSLALAKQMANSPEVRTAFFEGDTELLKTLSQSSYTRIKGEYRIIEYQYTLAPAKVFLNMDEPQATGADLSKLRLTLVAANTQQRDISSLELVDYGLCMHGIAAMQGEATAGSLVKGSVEYSIAIDRRVFNELRTKYGGDWQVLLSEAAMGEGGLNLADRTSPGPRPELMLQTTSLSEPVFSTAEAYDQALRGKTTIERVKSGASTYAILTMPLRDFRGRVVAVLDIMWDRTEALQQLRGRLLMAVAGGFVAMLLGAFIIGRIVNQTLQPVKALTIAAQAISKGDLRHPLPPMRRQGRSIDEVEDLTRSFHSMNQQLRQLVANLEKMVAERTQGLERRTSQLQTASEIGREVTMLSDVDGLLVQAVNLIRTRFDYYHAGVFLIEESGEMATLRAATGEAGQTMLEARHQLQVGLVGLVGAACKSGEPKVAVDVEQDAFHYKNPLLPDTRSEIAVPLRVGIKVIGALDVQSREPNAFGEGDITVLQVIADQLAVAVNNAQLIQELNRTVNELEEAHGQMTRENWQAIARTHSTGYRYVSSWSGTGEDGSPLDQTSGEDAWQESGGLVPLDVQHAPGEIAQAIRSGQAVVGTDGTDETLAVPIRLRGRPIGAMHLRFDSQVAKNEVIGLMEDISNRLGLLLESARLLEEAQRMAQREQQINVIATQMRSSVNLDTILQNTVRELGKALGARRAFIQLGQVEEPEQPEAEVRRNL